MSILSNYHSHSKRNAYKHRTAGQREKLLVHEREDMQLEKMDWDNQVTSLEEERGWEERGWEESHNNWSAI